jgi:hypothetical protein
MEESSQLNQNLPAAFEDLEPHHFPLFTTIKKLIFMLDASLENSFFTRDKDKNILGMNSNLGWHSEASGD